MNLSASVRLSDVKHHKRTCDKGSTDGPCLLQWKSILAKCPYDELDPRQYTYRYLCRAAFSHCKILDGFISLSNDQLKELYAPTANYHSNCLSGILAAIGILKHASPADALRNHAADNRKYKRRGKGKRGY